MQKKNLYVLLIKIALPFNSNNSYRRWRYIINTLIENSIYTSMTTNITPYELKKMSQIIFVQHKASASWHGTWSKLMKSYQRQELYFYTVIIKVRHSYNLQPSLNCIGKVKWERSTVWEEIKCECVCQQCRGAWRASKQQDCIFQHRGANQR